MANLCFSSRRCSRAWHWARQKQSIWLFLCVYRRFCGQEVYSRRCKCRLTTLSRFIKTTRVQSLSLRTTAIKVEQSISTSGTILCVNKWKTRLSTYSILKPSHSWQIFWPNRSRQRSSSRCWTKIRSETSSRGGVLVMLLGTENNDHMARTTLRDCV